MFYKTCMIMCWIWDKANTSYSPCRLAYSEIESIIVRKHGGRDGEKRREKAAFNHPAGGPGGHRSKNVLGAFTAYASSSLSPLPAEGGGRGGDRSLEDAEGALCRGKQPQRGGGWEGNELNQLAASPS